jgi:uncharacterized protein YciI
VQTVFLVFREPGAAWLHGVPLERQPGYRAHAAFIEHLFARGFLLFGGPLPELPGKVVMVLATPDKAAARELLQQDPLVQNGVLRIGSINEWAWQLALAEAAA